MERCLTLGESRALELADRLAASFAQRAAARDTLGMRATQSNDWEMRDVFVPADAVFHSYLVGRLDRRLLETVWGNATNNAVAMLDLAMEIAGSSGFFRRSPLERMYRDVRAGTVHPANDLDAEELIGKTALGIAVAPPTPAEGITSGWSA